MKAEDFVKQYYPDAKAVNTGSCYGFGNKHLYTYILATNDIGIKVHLADGNSESNAWVNAKKAIKLLNSEQSAQVSDTTKAK